MAVRLLLILSVVFIQLNAQTEYNYSYIESKTWQYYQQSQWDSLICLGEIALQHNIDYFYLRARLGYAYFKKANYIKAINQLQKAREYNSEDIFVFEILYYSFLYSNMHSEANYLLKNNQTITSKSSIRESLINMAYLESNISQSEDKENILGGKAPKNIKWLQNNHIHSIKYNAFGVQLCPSKRIISTVSYANLNMDVSRQVWIEENIIDDRYRLYQHQFYANALLRLKYRWYVLPAFNWIVVDFNTINSYFNSNENKVYLWRAHTLINNFVASLALKHRFNYVEWDVYTIASNLNFMQQQTIGTTVYWYPKGNINIYLIGNTACLFQQNRNYFVADEKFGFKAFSKVWIEQYFAAGKISNYSESNAYVIHNTSDICNYRTGVSLIFPFNKFKFSIRYMLMLKSSPYDYFDNRFKSSHFDYTEQSLFMNFSWWM
ncbi:MAG: hypothetical protein N2449_03740 [Bacteroidales bacterium]|nr:hypothetical protein [Bacteroidales bacterium]